MKLRLCESSTLDKQDNCIIELHSSNLIYGNTGRTSDEIGEEVYHSYKTEYKDRNDVWNWISHIHPFIKGKKQSDFTIHGMRTDKGESDAYFTYDETVKKYKNYDGYDSYDVTHIFSIEINGKETSYEDMIRMFPDMDTHLI